MKLTVRNLCKSYAELSVLNGFDLQMESGRVYCLMGPSGSGKTTLLRLLMGLEEADAGSILWENPAGSGQSGAADNERLPQHASASERQPQNAADSERQPQNAANSGHQPQNAANSPRLSRNVSGSAVRGRAGSLPRVSAVFQEDRLCEAFTPIENVMMVTGKLLSQAQVRSELARLLPEESLTRPVSTLSGGMKRRTAICRALLAPYDVLLMDEPFTGLDEDTRQTVISYILEKTAGRMVLISTHQEEDVALLGAELIRL